METQYKRPGTHTQGEANNEAEAKAVVDWYNDSPVRRYFYRATGDRHEVCYFEEWLAPPTSEQITHHN